MDQQKLNDYLVEFANQDDTLPEVRRFIDDLLIKVEFGHFEEDELEDCDNEAFNNW